ncbi:MAG: NTP transferase domain-containing protein, partial [Propionibacteriales bacterium]|nr:NTP transferase domain-containing protein [Propionibacteriales bacterium]
MGVHSCAPPRPWRRRPRVPRGARPPAGRLSAVGLGVPTAWLDGSVEAVIVAGGLGTRLLPLTESSPKPLLPVAGVPFAVHQLAKLAAAGVRRVLLATSYQADRFEPVLGDGSAWDLELV